MSNSRESARVPEPGWTLQQEEQINYVSTFNRTPVAQAMASNISKKLGIYYFEHTLCVISDVVKHGSYVYSEQVFGVCVSTHL
jgi:hypothetical protein